MKQQPQANLSQQGGRAASACSLQLRALSCRNPGTVICWGRQKVRYSLLAPSEQAALCPCQLHARVPQARCQPVISAHPGRPGHACVGDVLACYLHGARVSGVPRVTMSTHSSSCTGCCLIQRSVPAPQAVPGLAEHACAMDSHKAAVPKPLSSRLPDVSPQQWQAHLLGRSAGCKHHAAHRLRTRAKFQHNCCNGQQYRQ